MWVLRGENITTCNLIIIDVNITWLAKKNNEKNWEVGVGIMW